MGNWNLQSGLVFTVALFSSGVCFLAYQNYESVTPHPVLAHYFDANKAAWACDRGNKSYDECMSKLTDRMGWELVNRYGPHLSRRQADLVSATCKDLPIKMPGRSCSNPLDFEIVIRAVAKRNN